MLGQKVWFTNILQAVFRYEIYSSKFDTISQAAIVLNDTSSLYTKLIVNLQGTELSTLVPV